MYKGFDELPGENFDFLRSRVKMGRGDLWGQYILLLIFAALSALFRLDDTVELPLYGRIIDAVLYSAVGLYIIPCFILESKRLWNRSHRVKDVFTVIASVLIEILMLRLLLGYMLTAGSSLIDVDEETGTGLCYFVAGFLFICGIVLNILFWRRFRHRTIAGEFRANGSGFFGKSRFILAMIIILIILCPAPATAAIRYRSIGRLVTQLFDEGETILIIFGAFALTFVTGFVMILFAYLSCIYIADYYCFGRFGENQQLDGEQQETAD